MSVPNQKLFDMINNDLSAEADKRASLQSMIQSDLAASTEGFTQPVKMPEPGFFKSIGTSALSSAGSGIAGVGTALEDVGLQRLGTPVREYGEGIQQANPSSISQFSDILDKPKQFAGEALGQIGSSIAATGGGALIGRGLGTVIGAALPIPGAAPALGALGGLAGGFASNLAGEYGETRANQREMGFNDPSMALAAAVPAAALDYAADRYVGKIGKLGQLDAIPQGMTRPGFMAQEALKGALIEGPVTEVPQTVLERLGGGKDIASNEALNEYGIAGAMGALGGGVVSGGIGGFAPYAPPTQQDTIQPGATPAEQPAEPQQPMGLGSQWETPAFTNYPRQPDVPPTSSVGMTPEEEAAVNPLGTDPATNKDSLTVEPQGLGSKWQAPAFTLNPNQPVLGDVLAGASDESTQAPVAPGTDRMGSPGPEATAVDPVAAGGPDAGGERDDGLLSSTRQFNTAPGLATDPAPAAPTSGDVAGSPGAEAGQPNRDVLDAGQGAVDEAQNTGLVDQAKVAPNDDGALDRLRRDLKNKPIGDVEPTERRTLRQELDDTLQTLTQAGVPEQTIFEAINAEDGAVNGLQRLRQTIEPEQPPARGREEVTGTTEQKQPWQMRYEDYLKTFSPDDQEWEGLRATEHRASVQRAVRDGLLSADGASALGYPDIATARRNEQIPDILKTNQENATGVTPEEIDNSANNRVRATADVLKKLYGDMPLSLKEIEKLYDNFGDVLEPSGLRLNLGPEYNTRGTADHFNNRLRNDVKNAIENAYRPVLKPQEPTDAAPTPRDPGSDATSLSGGSRQTGAGELGVAGGTEPAGREIAQDGTGGFDDGTGGTGLQSSAATGGDSLDSVDRPALAPQFTETDKDNRFKLTNVTDLGGTEAVRARLKEAGVKVPGSVLDDNTLQFHSSQRDKIFKALEPTNDEQNQLSRQPEQPAQQEEGTQAQAQEEVGQYRKGEVGGKLASGEIVTTSSGRQTTPFPKVALDTKRKVSNTLKNVDQWLLQNALEEAKARGDEFNARTFEQDLKSRIIPPASKDAAEEYLFGKQPEVRPSILKPLTQPDAPNQPAPVAPQATQPDTQGTDTTLAPQTQASPESGVPQEGQPVGQGIDTAAQPDAPARAPWDDLAARGESWKEDRWHNTRVQVAPSMRGDTAWEGTVRSVLKTSSGQPWLEVQRDGQDGSVRVTPDRISVLDLKDSETTPEAQTTTFTTPEAQQKPAPGFYQPPANVSSRAGQMSLSDRGGRIAMLDGLNQQVAKANPAAAYSPDEIQNAADDRIDAMQDWLVSQQKPELRTDIAQSNSASNVTGNVSSTGDTSQDADTQFRAGKLSINEYLQNQGIDPDEYQRDTRAVSKDAKGRVPYFQLMSEMKTEAGKLKRAKAILPEIEAIESNLENPFATNMAAARSLPPILKRKFQQRFAELPDAGATSFSDSVRRSMRDAQTQAETEQVIGFAKNRNVTGNVSSTLEPNAAPVTGEAPTLNLAQRGQFNGANSVRKAMGKPALTEAEWLAEQQGTPVSRQEAGAAATRTKPKNTIQFSSAITGPSGAKMDSYTWQWREEDQADRNGEMRPRRVSDWEKAGTSDDTGRDIVHQFMVTKPDGSQQMMSAESAIKALGYAGADARGVKEAVTTSKTLARLQMASEQATQSLQTLNQDLAEIKAVQPDPIKTISPSTRHTVYQVGDVEGKTAGDAKRLWRVQQLKKRGWEVGDSAYDFQDELAKKAERIQDRLAKAQTRLDGILSRQAQPTAEQTISSAFSERSEPPQDFDAFAKANPAVRNFQPYTSEQRADRQASRRLGPNQRSAEGETFYTHPLVPGIAFPTRARALREAYKRTQEQAGANQPAQPTEQPPQNLGQKLKANAEREAEQKEQREYNYKRLHGFVMMFDHAGNLPKADAKRIYRKLESYAKGNVTLDEAMSLVEQKLGRNPGRMWVNERPKNARSPNAEPPAQEPAPDTQAPKVSDALHNDPEAMERVASLVAQAGWAQKGGYLYRLADGTPQRTDWLPKTDWWLERPDGTTEKDFKETLTRLQSGRKLSPKQERVADFLNDLQSMTLPAEDVIDTGHEQLDEKLAAIVDELVENALRDFGEDVVNAVVAKASANAEGRSVNTYYLGIKYGIREIYAAGGPGPSQANTGTESRGAGEGDDGGRPNPQEPRRPATQTEAFGELSAEDKPTADRLAIQDRERELARRRDASQAPRGGGLFDIDNRQDDIFSEPAETLPATDAEPTEPKPKKRKVSQKAKAEAIEDFGEKLEGARKDYAAKMQAALDVDIASEPLSKSWPEPDYQKMLDGGIDSWSVAFVRAMRDGVPTRPQKSWKLNTWVKQVKELRDFAMDIEKAGETEIAKLKMMLGVNRAFQDIAGRIELYQAVGHEKSLKGITLSKHDYTLYKGESNVTKWAIEQQTKATAFSNWPREIAVADSKKEVIAQFKAKYGGLELGGNARGKPSFIIYRKRGEEGAYVGKKIGREYVDLHKAADVTAAREYMSNNLDALEAKLKKYKETPYERNEENAPRVGEDHRNGAPVTPQVFGETFGFRGVQFGNYVEQDRRQSDLNEAYDGLMDMAAVLGIPAKAISLNGRLGLAFGARGKGGINAAAAHYEPDTVVINLTKGGGPGSLAHEFWHALDNYFAKEGGGKGFMTADAKGDALRAEMRDAFMRIKQGIRSTAMRERSRQLDKRRTKAYWATDEELSARAFESYIIAKLQDQNAANDYLANVVSQKAWDTLEDMRDFGATDKKPSYPYPTVDELPAIRAAFDEFFKTVQTKDTDQGVAMFSREQNPIFYSQLARAFDSAKSNAMPGHQWASWIKGNAAKLGVKADEIAWTGIDDYLTLRAKEKLTKAEIADYLSQNGVQVQDVMKGEPRSRPKITARRAGEMQDDGTAPSWAANVDRNMWVVLRSGEPIFTAEGGYTEREAIGNYSFDEDDDLIGDEPDTKFAQYTIPGGENYRELLLTLPSSTLADKALADRLTVFGTEDRGVIKYGIAEGDDYNKHPVTYATRAEAERERKRLIESSASPYKSGHWDEPNVLAHLRFDERTDADGQKVMFIQELQSDWGQEGKKKGFANEGRAVPDGLGGYKVIDKNGNDMLNAGGQVISANTPEQALSQVKSGLPSAPFVTDTKAWVSLALKQAIRHAAENGFDKIAFANGQQNADLYDLSKQISSIEYSANGNGTYDVRARDLAGDNTVWKDKAATEQTLADTLGKDIADKIVSGEGESASISGDIKRLSGLDLKVGGEGMRAFYDQIVPSVANDVLKKLGGRRVGAVNIGGTGKWGKQQITDGPSIGTWRVMLDGTPTGPALNTEDAADAVIARNNGATTQPGFTLTPELREKALGGLPLFARPGRPVQQKVGAVLSRDAVQARIDAIRPKLRISPSVTIQAVDSEAELPADIQAQARKEGAVGQVIAAHQGNSIFLVAGKHDSAAKVEESILHESNHYGANVLFGRSKHAIYNRLFTQLGGEKGIRDYANRLGLKMEPYFATARESRGNIQDQRINSYLVDEFLANAQGTKAYATLPQKIKTAIQEFYGAIRNWLRQQGFAELAKFTDADLAYLLRSIHKAAQGEVVSGRGKPMFMVAWHGSPHDHDKFSTSKIGTGEGAQAFGYGLYFSNAKDIAEHYRQKLSPFTYNGRTINASRQERFRSAVYQLWAAKGDKEKAKRADRSVRDIIDRLDYDKIGHKGRLYQVELAPAEDEYLDWHKPLSEQSEKVKAALDPIAEKFALRDDDRGRGIYRIISDYDADAARDNDQANDKAASEYLHSLGIRGIRYPAEGLTGGKSGDRFNYVIFDENDIEITAKFSRAGQTIDVDGVQREYEETKAKYINTPGWLKAPNGKPSNLNERQWVQVRTSSFKAWFGDWEAYINDRGGVWTDANNEVSKVVDENGEPRVVYHGAKRGGFTVLDPNEGDKHRSPMVFMAGTRTTSATYAGSMDEIDMPESIDAMDQAGLESIGYQFEEYDDGRVSVFNPDGSEVTVRGWDKALAEAKADLEFQGYPETDEQRGIYSLFLNIRNPYEANFEGANWDGQRLYDQFSVWDSEEQEYVYKDGSSVMSEDDARALYEDLGGDDVEWEGRPRYDVQEAPELGETTNTVAEEAKQYGHDGAIINSVVDDGGQYGGADTDDVFVIFKSNQAKSATQNTGAFSALKDDLRFSRQYTPEQQAVIDKFAAGQTMQQKPWRERVQDVTDNWQTAWAQKVVDRYRSFRDILRNPELWMQARLAGQSEGAVHAGIHFGAPEWDAMGQAIQANLNTKPLEQINQDLGGEINDFFKWVAAQRADRINRKADTAAQMAEILGNDIGKLESQIEALSQAKGNQAERIAELQQQITETRREMNAARKAARIRERFLDDETIAAALTFNEGTMADGRDRATVYAQALKDFNKLNDAYVNLNVEAGAISEEDAERWRSEGVYVPFYRFLQDDEGNTSSRGLRDLASLDKQTAFKQFKGSAIPLNDLLSNVLANWHHLAHTATHNATAVKALEQASDMGLAERIPESQADDKSLWVREDGKKVFYRLANDSKDAKLVWESIQGMNYQGWKNGAMDAAQAMAGLLRAGVTANPVYRYRNLIRDTFQALATSNVPLNAVVKGWKQTGPKTIEEIQRYANMLASGGLFGIHEAGYLREGNPGAANAKAMLKLGAKPDTDNAILLTQVTLSRMWDKYQDAGARLENVNRAAAFTKTYDETGSLLKAAFEANDLMPFQMRGTSQILFNLSRVVPFFNSRLQGLDKLARSATDPETRQRFWAVTGTYVALSLMAYMALKDDDDYEELEQWKRDAYHYFKVDGQLYKLPRPFEMGVLAMLVERTAEQVFKDVPASLWVDRVMSALGDTFAMNPIPQALKPMVDVYANRDSFTGRPIESLGMENRSKTQRKTPDSSYVGVGVSEALDALFKTMTLGKQETPLSPVQVDELVKGYLGWVGSFALAGSNMILDGITGAPDKPEDIRRIPIVGDMLNAISESDTPRSTAYSSAFYDHLKIVRQAQADFNQARKLGDTRQMQEIRNDKPAAFAAKDAYNKAASNLTDINNMMQKIQAGNDPGDVKKRKLDELTRRKNRITQTIESRFGKTLETF